MPINLQGSGNIAEGWGPAPQLHAPELGSMVAAILRNKLERDKMTGESIADTIRNVRGEMQSNKYLDAMKAAGLIGQDYEAGGLGGATLATKLAELRIKQAGDPAMDAYHNAAAAKEQAIADAIKNGTYGRGGSRGGGGSDTDYDSDSFNQQYPSTKVVNGVTFYRRLDTHGRVNYVPLQTPLQPTTSRPLSETDTYRTENDLLKQKENLELSRKIQEQEDIKAKRAGVPFRGEDEYQKLLKEIETVRQKRGQPQATPQPAPADVTPGPPVDQTVVPEEPNTPVTPGEKIDPTTAQQYLIKAHGNRTVAQQLAQRAGWTW